MNDLLPSLLVVLGIGLVAFVVAALVPTWLATRAAARRGVKGLARGDFATLAGLDAVTFDKLRTITTGELVVISVDPIKEDADRDLRWFAGALEHHAAHPIGRAIAKLSTRGNVTGVQEVAGYGISGSVDRHPVRIGRPSWLGIDAADEVGAVVAVEVDSRTMGTITVADEAEPAAASHLGRLQSLGVTPIYMSADPMARAKDLANRVGVDHLLAEILPENRREAERRLDTEYRSVAHFNDTASELRFGAGSVGFGSEPAPLKALAEVIELARSLPARTRLAWILAGGLTLASALAIFTLL